MRVLSAAIWWALCLSAAMAQPNGPLMLGSSGGSPGVPYVGPGDLVSGATSWYGLRAYTAAYAAGLNKAVKVKRVDNSATSDINLLANGNLDDATLTTFCAGTVCNTATWYDQSGNGFNVTDHSATTTPTIIGGALGGHTVLDFTGARYLLFTGSSPTVAQPLTFSIVAKRTGSVVGATNIILSGAGTFAQISWNAGANTVRVYGGTVLSATQTDSAWHAIQGVLNGASSSVKVDATTTSGAAGASGLAGNISIGADNSGGSGMVGQIAEAGFWPSAISAANQTAICHNQFVYWGTSTSC